MASGQWAGSTRRSTLPADWPRVRNHVLKRDGRICRIRGPLCIGIATEVDHTGDREDHRPEVLQAACNPCHQAKSSGQGGAALGRVRKQIAAARKRKPEAHPGVVRDA